MKSMSSKALDLLRNPLVSLRKFGKVQDQKTGRAIVYDPNRITENLQSTILSYYADPPLTVHNQVAWFTLLGYRQGGKSTCGEIGVYPKVSYSPGWDHVCIADTKDRAEYLHGRVHYTHSRWPESVRAPTIRTREVRQLTFDQRVGGKMRILSSKAAAAGIGESPDSWHGSEIPFWEDAGKVFNLVYPSMVNRDHAMVLLEATPAPLDAMSVDWWSDHIRDAKLGLGRWVYAFFPFWDGILNRRPWNYGELDKEERELMVKYSSQGLTLENLAFRRFMFETDAEIRRNPDLFRVFYPFDDVTCWMASGLSVIHRTLLERHRDGPLEEWISPYTEYKQPEEGASYVIGADPAGFAARDHAAFQVVEVFDKEWDQCAVYADHVDPITMAKKLFEVGKKYNNALICVESNGVGAAVIALLIELGYNNLYYEKPYKPGIHVTAKSIDELLAWLQDALRDDLILHDSDTFIQLCSYKHDKRVERAVQAEILHGGAGNRRRERHHWDKVSALTMAVAAARRSPSKVRSTRPEEMENVVLFRDMSWDQMEEYRREERERKEGTRRRRVSYRSIRRRRR